MNEFEDVPEAVMCIARYVDCSKRGGYDPADTCRQTCLKAEDDPEEMSHKYLQDVDVIELPELELTKMKGEIDAFFAMGPTGTKAVESFLSKQFRLYMEQNMKAKKEPDNLKLRYNVRYYKTRFGHYKRLVQIAEKADKEANPVRYEVEEKKKHEEEVKAAELEAAAFEKQENVLLEEFEQAKESENRDESINGLLKKQLESYQKSIEWAKESAVDPKVNDRAKQMAKKSAQWEQKKYITLRNEIHQDNIKQEIAKEEAEREAKEAEEQRESAGIELTSTERTTLYTEVKEATAVEFTGNEEKDDKLLKDQLDHTVVVAEKYKKNMINTQNMMTRNVETMTEEENASSKESYYKNKLKYESVMKIVDGMRTTIETKEAAKPEYKISDEEKESIGKTIEKYQNYNATGDEEQDKVAGKNLLKKFEDNAKQAVDRYQREYRADPEYIEMKKKYFLARDKYKQISKMTGTDSPAKVAERKTLEEAKTKNKKLIVVGAITELENNNPVDVAVALEVAGAKQEVAEVLKR